MALPRVTPEARSTNRKVAPATSSDDLHFERVADSMSPDRHTTGPVGDRLGEASVRTRPYVYRVVHPPQGQHSPTPVMKYVYPGAVMLVMQNPVAVLSGGSFLTTSVLATNPL